MKKQRLLGTKRGTQQAPAIEVRAKGLPPVPIACRCRLWNFGSCLEKEPPCHDASATQLTMLRSNVQIDVKKNVALFGPEQDDGYRYARLRCFITRGARVPCRKFHIAFHLDCVYLPPGMVLPDPNDSNFATGELVENFPRTRSARMSISEKAIRPGVHDRTKKPRSKALKNALNGSTGDSSSEASVEESSPKRLKPPSSVASNHAARGGNNGLSSNHFASAVKKTPSPIMSKTKGKGLTVGLSAPPFVLQGVSMFLREESLPDSIARWAIQFVRRSTEARPQLLLPMPGERDIPASQSPRRGRIGLDGIRSRARETFPAGYWRTGLACQQSVPYCLNQPVQSRQVAAATATAAAVAGGNGVTPESLADGSSRLSGVSAQSPSFGQLQGGLTYDFSSVCGLSQRRVSTCGQWSAERQSSRISTMDAICLSSSPMPPNQPGGGPQWEALLEAHAKVLSFDKSSPDYLTKKVAAMTELSRAAELIEQRILEKQGWTEEVAKTWT